MYVYVNILFVCLLSLLAFLAGLKSEYDQLTLSYLLFIYILIYAYFYMYVYVYILFVCLLSLLAFLAGLKSEYDQLTLRYLLFIYILIYMHIFTCMYMYIYYLYVYFLYLHFWPVWRVSTINWHWGIFYSYINVYKFM
jgi:hypothetical protein